MAGTSLVFKDILAVFILVFTWIGSAEGKFADSCVGNAVHRDSLNKLECKNGGTICVLEIRHYQWDPLSLCPLTIEQPTSSDCCDHDESKCSWRTTRKTELEELQRNCSGKVFCSSHFGLLQFAAEPCVPKRPYGQYSNVRSVRFKCILFDEFCETDGGPIVNDPTTTTTREPTTTVTTSPVTTIPKPPDFNTQPTSKTESRGTERAVTQTSADTTPVPSQNTGKEFPATTDPPPTNTGTIVGAVLGVLLVCGLVVGGLLLYRWRKKQRDNNLSGGLVSVTSFRSNPNHYVGGNAPISPSVNAAYTTSPSPLDRGYSINYVYNTLTGNTEDPSDYILLGVKVTDLGNGKLPARDGSYINVPKMKDAKTSNGSVKITPNDRPESTLYEQPGEPNDYVNVESDNRQDGRDYIELKQ